MTSKLERTPFNLVPKEILHRIFEYCSPTALARISRVCKLWKQIASSASLWNGFDLKTLYPSIKFIDAGIWRAHVDLQKLKLDLTDDPPVNKRSIIPLIHKFISTVEVEGNEGITYLTMPKGLTVSKVTDLAKSPKGANQTVVFTNVYFEHHFKDTPIKQTYSILITNSVISKSRKLSFIGHQELLRNLGCEMPGVLEALTLAILSYKTSEKPGIRLLNDSPETFTRTSTEVKQSQSIKSDRTDWGYEGKLCTRRLIVGNFEATGLNIEVDDENDSQKYGVCAKLIL